MVTGFRQQEEDFASYPYSMLTLTYSRQHVFDKPIRSNTDFAVS
jgi:hypothetical protein